MLAVSWEPHHVLWDCVGLISSREKGNFYYIQVQIIHISQRSFGVHIFIIIATISKIKEKQKRFTLDDIY